MMKRIGHRVYLFAIIISVDCKRQSRVISAVTNLRPRSFSSRRKTRLFFILVDRIELSTFFAATWLFGIIASAAAGFFGHGHLKPFTPS